MAINDQRFGAKFLEPFKVEESLFKVSFNFVLRTFLRNTIFSHGDSDIFLNSDQSFVTDFSKMLWNQVWEMCNGNGGPLLECSTIRI